MNIRPAQKTSLTLSSPIIDFIEHIDLFNIEEISKKGWFHAMLKSQFDENDNEVFSFEYLRHAWFLQHLCLYKQIISSFSSSISSLTPLQQFIDVLGEEIILEAYRPEIFSQSQSIASEETKQTSFFKTANFHAGFYKNRVAEIDKYNNQYNNSAKNNEKQKSEVNNNVSFSLS